MKIEDRCRRVAAPCGFLTRILAALAGLAFCSSVGTAQYLSLSAGPTAAFGGLDGERPTGVGIALSIEEERFDRGLARRGELFVSGFKAPPELEDVTGPIRNIALLGHAVYVIPRSEVEPYDSVGIGPAWRGVGSPSRESHWGALAAVSAGLRLGPREKRMHIEARVATSMAAAGGGGRPLQTWGLLLLGVNLGEDVGGRVE